VKEISMKMNTTQKHISAKAIPLTGMVGVLVIAYGLDRWLEVQRKMAAQTLNSVPHYWLWIGANLLIAGSLLALSWLVIFRGDRSRPVASILLIVGLLLTLYPVFAVTAYSAFSVPEPMRLLAYLLPNSLLAHSGAFLAVIGLVSLVSGKRGES